jgi:uncharacterized glyoxalase superfamily protein PhnB
VVQKEVRVQLCPYLTFDGQCEAAFKFYEECLHGKTIFMMTYENTPMDLQAPPDWRKKISHATFALAEFMFYGADALPGHYQKPQGFALQFNLSDPVEADAYSMPWQKMGLFKCRSRKHFGPFVLAYSLTNSASNGTSTARSRPDSSTSHGAIIV